MSDANPCNRSSATTDGAVSQPKRCAHGSDIGEALRARTIQKLEAEVRYKNWAEKNAFSDIVASSDIRIAAYKEMYIWIAAEEADAATLTREERSPTS